MTFSYLKKIQYRLISQQEQDRQHFHLPAHCFYFSWLKQSAQGKVLCATISLKRKCSISHLRAFYAGQKKNSLQLSSRHHMHNQPSCFKDAKLSIVLGCVESHIVGKGHLRKPTMGNTAECSSYQTHQM